MSRSLKSVFLIMAGVISIVLSIWCFTMKKGSSASYNTYGGDAYTGMQNASAQAANNIVELASIQKKGFGSILLVAGIVLVIVGIPENGIDYKKVFNPSGNPNINPQQTHGQYNQNNASQLNSVNAQYNVSQANAMGNQVATPETNKLDSIEEIKRAKKSLDSGEITQEEFDKKKQELLRD